MQENHPSQDKQGTHIGSTKRKLLQDGEINQQASKKTTKIQDYGGGSAQRRDYHDSGYSPIRDIARINEQLKYMGISVFEHLQQCPPSHLNQISNIMGSLMNKYVFEKDKANKAQSNSFDLERQKNKLIRQNDLLSTQINHYALKEQQANEKIKLMKQEFKEKEEKAGKDRDNLLKEKKAYESREQGVRNQFKKKNQQISILQAKLNKMMQKNDKTQYRAVFDLGHYRQAKSFIEKECDAIAIREAKEREQIEENIREEARKLMMKIYDEIQRVVKIDQDHNEIQRQRQRYQNMLRMPFEHSKGLVEIVKDMMVRIQNLIYKKDQGANGVDPKRELDSGQLVRVVQRMKGLFEQSKKVEEIRSSFTKNLFSQLNRTQSLKLAVLDNINNSLQNFDRPDEISFFVQDLTNQSQKVHEMQQYVKSQINFMARRGKFLDQLRRDIDRMHDSDDLL